MLSWRNKTTFSSFFFFFFFFAKKKVPYLELCTSIDRHAHPYSYIRLLSTDIFTVNSNFVSGHLLSTEGPDQTARNVYSLSAFTLKTFSHDTVQLY